MEHLITLVMVVGILILFLERLNRVLRQVQRLIVNVRKILIEAWKLRALYKRKKDARTRHR